jgi:predicted phosphoribosyltransferase
MRLRDRMEAGEKLAQKLKGIKNIPNPLVLALPRGGIPVGLEIAHYLNAPFDIWLVRKLGVPHNEELAMGAISYGNEIVLNEEIIHKLAIPETSIDREIQLEKAELERRNQVYRQGREAPEVRGMDVILVDDGLATGATMRAAISSLRKQSPRRIIAALPVAPVDVYEILADADQIICLKTPEPFYGVGMHYKSFPQLSDGEVKDMLAQEYSAN